MKKTSPLLRPAARTVSFVDEIVGRNLRALRVASGRGQREAGMAAGVTVQQMQKYEAGVNRLSLGALLALRQFYDVPLSALLRGLPGALTGLAEGGAEPANEILPALYARLALIRDPARLRQIGQIIEVLAATG